MNQINPKKQPVLVILLVLLIISLFWFMKVKDPHVVVNGQKIKVDIADSEEERKLGLSVKASLAENSGMLFIFDKPGSYGFWMKDMKFPIDIIWISGGKVIDIHENVLPPAIDSDPAMLESYFPRNMVDSVLEINAGQAAAIGINIGQYIEFRNINR